MSFIVLDTIGKASVKSIALDHLYKIFNQHLVTVTISPSAVSGHIQAPASKSCMQRACAAALINEGTTIIENAGTSNDEQAAKKIVEKLGASVDTVGKEVIITSSKHIFSAAFPGKHSVISCGESGLSLRMFTPLAALFNYEITFTGEGSILKGR